MRISVHDKHSSTREIFEIRWKEIGILVWKDSYECIRNDKREELFVSKK